MPNRFTRPSIQPTWVVVVLIAVALALSACGGQAAGAPALPTPTQAAVQPEPTEPPIEAATEAPDEQAAAPTDAPTEAPAEAPAEPPPTETSPAAAQPLTLQIVPGESQVRYEVGETFFDQDNRFNLAVGVTPEISGEVVVDPANPQNSSIGTLTIDISQFRSDSGRRDNALRSRFLESSSFPTATFTPTAIEGLPDSYAPGQPLTFQVTGDLTVRETTRPVTFDVTARLDGDTLTGTAETTLLMSDFGIGPITIAGILGTEDEVRLVMDFVAR